MKLFRYVIDALKGRFASDIVYVAVSASPAKAAILFKPELTSAVRVFYVIRILILRGIGADIILCIRVLQKRRGVIIGGIDFPVEDSKALLLQ